MTASATGVTAATARFTLVVTVNTLGTVSPAAGSGGLGGSFSIPVSLSLASGTSVDSLSFGLQIVPNGSAPVLSGAPSFAKDASLPALSILDDGLGRI